MSVGPVLLLIDGLHKRTSALIFGAANSYGSINASCLPAHGLPRVQAMDDLAQELHRSQIRRIQAQVAVVEETMHVFELALDGLEAAGLEDADENEATEWQDTYRRLRYVSFDPGVMC